MNTSGTEQNVLGWGETTERPKEEHEFLFAFNIQQDKFQLKIPLTIPLKDTVHGLMYRIIASHNVPCYIHNGKVPNDLLTF